MGADYTFPLRVIYGKVSTYDSDRETRVRSSRVATNSKNQDAMKISRLLKSRRQIPAVSGLRLIRTKKIRLTQVWTPRGASAASVAPSVGTATATTEAAIKLTF
jgi:hypothetical protein